MAPYQRVLLKLSGEIFLNSHKGDSKISEKIALSIKDISEMGVQVGIVLGGGNILRGATTTFDRVAADQMGMLATIFNGIAFQQILQQIGCKKSRILSAIPCETLVETYQIQKAKKYLADGDILLFVGGTGNPYFTTDTAAALRALEMEAEILLKATKVDGIYLRDPLKFPEEKKLEKISYLEVLQKELGVMDAAAVVLCKEKKIPICVFDLFEEKSLKRAVLKERVGTLVVGG